MKKELIQQLENSWEICNKLAKGIPSAEEQVGKLKVQLGQTKRKKEKEIIWNKLHTINANIGVINVIKERFSLINPEEYGFNYKNTNKKVDFLDLGLALELITTLAEVVCLFDEEQDEETINKLQKFVASMADLDVITDQYFAY